MEVTAVGGWDAQSGVRSGQLRREVVSFARRDGRYRRRLAQAWHPEHAGLVVVPQRAERSLSVATGWRFDPLLAFGRVSPVVIEIGTGTGEAILAAAAAEPHRDFLGVEVYRPGLARTVLRARELELTNLRVLEADARAVLRTGLVPDSIDEIRVFFPDPWPKPRHHKRRLVDPSAVVDMAASLRPGGLLRLATDWDDYAGQMVSAVAGCEGLERLPSGRFAGRPVTRFETKAADAGRLVHDFTYRRV